MSNARSAVGGRLSGDEVLLLWRALLRFRSGRDPTCARRGTPPVSSCPLYDACPRWRVPSSGRGELDAGGDDDAESWPCSRLLDLLDPEVNWIGRRR